MTAFVSRSLTVNRPITPVTSANRPFGFQLQPGEEFTTIEPQQPEPRPDHTFGIAFGNLGWVPNDALVER